MSTIVAENTSRLAELYLRYSHGDVAVIDELFADDVVVHLIGQTLLAADYEGRQALREFMARTIEMNHSPERFQLELVDTMVGRSHIAFLGRVAAQASPGSAAEIIRTHDILRLDAKDRVAEMWSFVL